MIYLFIYFILLTGLTIWYQSERIPFLSNRSGSGRKIFLVRGASLLFGHQLTILSQGSEKFFQKAFFQYGRIFGIKIFRRRLAVIYDQEIVRHLLETQKKEVSILDHLSHLDPTLNSSSLDSVNQKLDRILDRGKSHSYMLDMEKQLKEEVDVFVHRIMGHHRDLKALTKEVFEFLIFLNLRQVQSSKDQIWDQGFLDSLSELLFYTFCSVVPLHIFPRFFLRYLFDQKFKKAHEKVVRHLTSLLEEGAFSTYHTNLLEIISDPDPDPVLESCQPRTRSAAKRLTAFLIDQFFHSLHVMVSLIITFDQTLSPDRTFVRSLIEDQDRDHLIFELTAIRNPVYSSFYSPSLNSYDDYDLTQFDALCLYPPKLPEESISELREIWLNNIFSSPSRTFNHLLTRNFIDSWLEHDGVNYFSTLKKEKENKFYPIGSNKNELVIRNFFSKKEKEKLVDQIKNSKLEEKWILRKAQEVWYFSQGQGFLEKDNRKVSFTLDLRSGLGSE